MRIVSSCRTLLLRMFVIVVLSASFSPLYAQLKTIEGHVHDSKGEPLVGASVMITGTKIGTTTDLKGHFSIKTKDGARLQITRIGYNDRNVIAKDRIDIILIANNTDLSQVVVIGYGSQSRRKLTAAVSTISGDDIRDVPEASFDQMLQGRLAGVSVQSTTGEPGAKPNIVIRGSTNLDYGNANGGNTGPLYVIDGIIYDVNGMGTSYGYSDPLSLIDPADIESIDVLKDASATAIYGARGGNGVIIVKTRRAKTSRPQVTLSAYMGVTGNPTFKKILTGDAERNLKLGLLEGELPYGDLFSGYLPQQLTDSLNPAFNNDVDWQHMLIRNSAIVNNEDIAVSSNFGAGNSYRLSLNHYSEQGAVKGYGVERFAPSFNITIVPVKHVNLYGEFTLSSEKHTHGAGMAGNPFLFSSWNFPTSLAQLTEQEIQAYSGAAGIYDDDRILSFIGNLRLEDTLTKNLLFTSSFSANNYTENYNYFSPTYLNGIQNQAYSINNNNPNWTWENYLQYTKHIKKNNFTAVAGYSAYRASNYYSFAEAAGIQVSGIYTLQTVPSGSNLSVNTSNATKTTESYYARLLYDYAGKYLFTASLRRDASSIYSPQYQWGTFPSFSAGWVISDESFFKPIKKVVNFMKFRASWGVTGQDPGSWYVKYQQLYNDASYLGGTTGSIVGNALYSSLGGTPSTYNGTTVVTPYNYGNNFINNGIKSSDNVRWEKYPQWDIGLDWNMFNDRLTFVADWYQKDADNKFLWSVPADATTGYMNYSGNYANVRNTGLELTINSRNLGPKSAFQWNTSFNISFDKNWVTKLPNGDRDLLYGDPWFRKVITLGSPLFSYKLWQVKGVYATEADVPTDPITGNKITYFGTPMQAGDSKIVDQNGDYNIDYEDQVPDGSSPLPKFTGGLTNTFSYKNFSLMVFTSFSYGNKILNGNLSDALNGSASYPSWIGVAGPASFPTILNQFWATSGDQTKYPRYIYANNTYSTSDPWNISRSYFLEPGGFIKIKQVTLGYNLPNDLMRRWKIKGINVYGMVENLHIFKQAKDIPDPELYDPTTGSDNITYPTGMKFTFGTRINF
ncbi:MAG TPA: SusC/RagA family TonB-linked outer membrane protein [Arachidicoccus soli]|nr:SusC/RagA family TonB-linked outer membrane protein [Arachidicoccus soli]